MPLLNRRGELLEQTTISDGAGAAGGLALVTPEKWNPLSGDGLLLEADTEPEARFSTAGVIAINFPAFSDGRGLSLAVLLRSRYQYKGELRAVGDVHPDLLHYMKRCGFDTFDMPEERHWPGAGHNSPLEPHSDYYQASVLEPDPAYRRIRRGA